MSNHSNLITMNADGTASLNLPPTYTQKNIWDVEVPGLKWYVEWKEKDITVTTAGRFREMHGHIRLNYFKTKKAAYDFINERHREKDYEWYKEPGWEGAVS
jgi:hypothetical protein